MTCFAKCRPLLPPTIFRALKPPVKLASSLLSLLCCLTVAASAKDPELPIAPSPIEVVHEGLQDPAFLAIDANDVVFVSEEQAGRVLQIFPDGRVRSVVEGLQKPRGLAIDDDGTLYIAAEEYKGTKLKDLVLKWEGGSLQVLASGLNNPTGLTVDENGTLYVVAEGEDETRGRISRIDPSGGPLTLIATGFKHPSGLASTPDGQLLVAAERLQGEGEADGGTIYQVNPDNGIITRLMGSGFQHPHSVVLDRLGGLFFSAETPSQASDWGRINKRLADGTLTTFAAPLQQPRGLAFDRQGNLYAIEAKGGRLLRFRAPPSPSVDPLAAFTNMNPLTVTGAADPDALITITEGASAASTITFGSFAIPVSLTPNRLNTFTLFVTGAEGLGLTGAPIEATITHDDVPPVVRIVSPAEGATLTGAFTVDMEATDALSGIAVVELLVDGNVVGVTNVAPYRFSLEAESFTGGPHAVTARVTDRAGNQASASIGIVIVGLRVTITTPAEGANVQAGVLLVRGTVEAAGEEVGVLMNSIPGAVQGTTFAALIPVTPETTTLTAMATTATGMTASHSVSITVTPASIPTTVLLANPQSGVAPLTVSFSLLGASPGATISVNFDGDGAVDATGSSLDGQVFTYPKPGLYFPTVTITDAQGNQVATTTLIQVYDQAALNASLQAKWAAMKDALRRGNIAQAVTQIAGRSRARYEAAFRIIAPRLPEIDSILPVLTLVKVRDRSAIYEATRIDNGLPKSFEVRFAFDGDGIWRIEAF